METADPVADLRQAAELIHTQHPAGDPMHIFWSSVAAGYTQMVERHAAGGIVTVDDWALWHAMVRGARIYQRQGGYPRRHSVRLRLRYLSGDDAELTREQAVRAAGNGQPVTVHAVRLGQPLTAQVLQARRSSRDRRGTGVHVDWPGNVAADQAYALSLVVAEAARLAAITDQDEVPRSFRTGIQ
jgi:hypothetical protein